MKIRILTVLVAILMAVRGVAAPEIVGFVNNGMLVASNLTAGTTAAVLWAASPGAIWTNTWSGLDAIPVGASGVIQVPVPFFYRVEDRIAVAVTTTTTLGTTTSTTLTPTSTSSTTTALPVPQGLQPGDIAIIGYASDAPDSVHWVNLVDIPAGTTISFSQNGYQTGVGFSASESGDNFTYTYAAQTAAGTIAAKLDWINLSASGDNVFMYRHGVLDLTNMVYGLVANGSAAGWGEDVPTSNGADLPATLVEGYSAVAITPEVDNGHFNTAVLAAGSRAEWLAAIGNKANWITDDASPGNLTYPSGTIVVGTSVTTTDTSTTTTTSTSSTTAPAALPLTPGDVAIIRVNATTDTFTVLALRALSANDVAYWTDNGWKADNTFRANEGNGTTDWIATTVSAGQTLEVTGAGFNAAGDQVFLMLGTVASPTLLYGIDWSNTAGWDADAADSSTSADPAVSGGGLADAHTVSVGADVSWKYTGTRTGTRDDLLTAIADSNNWAITAETVWADGAFTVEP